MLAVVCILFAVAAVSPAHVIAFIAYGLALAALGFYAGYSWGVRRRQRRSRG